MKIVARLAKMTRQQGSFDGRRLLHVMAFASMTIVSAHADGDPAHGKIVFGRCAACHSITGENRIGPPLNGVIGRAAGSVTGTRYSSAMSNAQTVWDEQNLDRFLTAPAGFLPGTTMTVSLPQARDRSDLIAYLKTLGPK
ncbi:cytochrome c family protein [Mesorhizobium sp. YR577]|uniref:c-type cytochrome n=1 Tax=Mesorhizobium sp. YR577 TaxID=1884373 RepID=UPI0008E4157B|nr:cytochrome c family protein [Mesorhizobium sp. YR577]SFU22335.1 cytochrome c [Mesorhizobium sp. YR577]